MWLSAGMFNPSFRLSNNEFTAAMSRRNTTENPLIPSFNSHGTSDNHQNYQCSCGGPAKMIDQFGYHITGCKKDANAICLHDNIVHVLVSLLCLLGLSVALVSMNLFSDFEPDVDPIYSSVTLTVAVNK